MNMLSRHIVYGTTILLSVTAGMCTITYAQNPKLHIPQQRFALPEYVSSLLSEQEATRLTRLLNMNIEAGWGWLRGQGYPYNFIGSVRPVYPDMRFAGRARTGRYLPYRKDLDERYKEPSLNARTSVATEPGDILVFDMGGDLGASPSGDVSCLAAMVRGCAGVVVNGVMRDVPAFINMRLPLFTIDGRGHAAAGGSHVISWDYQVPVRVGDAAIVPGDYLVGAAHGVLVVPAPLVDEMLAYTEKKDLQEDFQRRLILDGEPVTEVYPLNEANKKRFDEWVKTQH